MSQPAAFPVIVCAGGSMQTLQVMVSYSWPVALCKAKALESSLLVCFALQAGWQSWIALQSVFHIKTTTERDGTTSSPTLRDRA